MSYNKSSEMNSYIYTRNYGQPPASKELRERNLNYLKLVLPNSERNNIDLYLDPGGNISRDCLGNIKQDINKIMDQYKK
jgi:hypothetical protein